MKTKFKLKQIITSNGVNECWRMILFFSNFFGYKEKKKFQENPENKKINTIKSKKKKKKKKKVNR